MRSYQGSPSPGPQSSGGPDSAMPLPSDAGVAAASAGAAVFGPVQQRVAFHRVGQFGFQFDGRQLQQADRLPQLRRHDQMLTERGWRRGFIVKG